MNIGIIGYGVMGKAMVSAILKEGIVEKVYVGVRDMQAMNHSNHESIEIKNKNENVTVKNTSSFSGENTASGEIKNSIVYKSNGEVCKHVDYLIIAVKPQTLHVLAEEICGKIHENTVVISVLAGVTVKTLQEVLACKKVVRTMPNTPTKIGEGVTGWYANEYINIDQKNYTKNMIKSFGQEVELDSEEKIDRITAITGSGPAYIFYLGEILVQQAREFGFTQEESEKMVAQLVFGSAILMKNEVDQSSIQTINHSNNLSDVASAKADQSTKLSAEETLKNPDEIPACAGMTSGGEVHSHFEQLRKNVSSKGGATAKAIEYMQKHNMTDIVKKGALQSYLRAKEMGQ